jgi:MoxR-like ATPase
MTDDVTVPPIPQAEPKPVDRVQEHLQALQNEIRKIITGQDIFIEMLVTTLLAEGHVLIEGVPGLAKTLTAKALAHTINLPFNRIQFTPDLMPSDVIGTNIFNQKNVNFEFHKGPLFANIVLIDEINRAPAKTQAALFEVMQENQVTVDGILHPVPMPFMVVATQNPIEHEGTYRLPEAELDRFLMKITVQYPSPQDELAILRNKQSNPAGVNVSNLQKVLSADDIKSLQEATRRVHLDDSLLQYIVNLTIATRDHPALYLGASPRATSAVWSAAKAQAIINARNYVIPEDIQTILPAVLNHRLILTPDKEMEGETTTQVIQQIINRIEVPR